MTNDHSHCGWTKRGRGDKDVFNERSSRHLVEHFGARRLHARAFARGENNNVELQEINYRAVCDRM
jgi:hypothetical protein